MQAVRARTLAEWRRDTSTRMTGLREIDRKASQVNSKLSEEEKGIVRTVQMGGTMAKQYIATFNQQVDDKCTYCKEEAASGSHIRWQCKHFEPVREETDKDLAQIPRHYLLECIRCGVAPAMKIEGELTYWGMNVDKKESRKTKEMLGVSLELTTAGADGDITRKRNKAAELINDPERGMKNGETNDPHAQRRAWDRSHARLPDGTAGGGSHGRARSRTLHHGLWRWQPYLAQDMVGSPRGIWHMDTKVGYPRRKPAAQSRRRRLWASHWADRELHAA